MNAISEASNVLVLLSYLLTFVGGVIVAIIWK